MLSHEYRALAVSISNRPFLPFELGGVSGFRNMTDSGTNGRLATFYYTADGKTAKEQVWEETMKELSFAHVEEIVASMK